MNDQCVFMHLLFTNHFVRTSFKVPNPLIVPEKCTFTYLVPCSPGSQHFSLISNALGCGQALSDLIYNAGLIVLHYME